MRVITISMSRNMKRRGDRCWGELEKRRGNGHPAAAADLLLIKIIFKFNLLLVNVKNWRGGSGGGRHVNVMLMLINLMLLVLKLE